MQLIMNERLAALGQMAAGIAHEINNPLATIAGCAEGLLNRTRKGQLEPALFQDYLGIIEEEIARCKAITSSMLSFVRKGDPQRQVLNVHEVLDRTLELIGFQGRLRNVELLKDYAAWVEPVRAAEVELKQVFVALLSNALDAMLDAGALVIATGGNDRSIRVSIKDSGPGVPAAIAGRIFDPFFTTKHGEGGTGLGLSIARRIVESLGGTLTLDSTPGKGAVATLTLPRADSGPPPAD
jgi:two-component system NtrC family sensor kinase